MKKERTKQQLESIRRKVELTSGLGLMLIAAGLLVPLFNMLNTGIISAFKWVYSAGALVYIAAKCVDISDPKEPLRLRRIRRMEFWSGMAFAVGAFFWFYDSGHLGPYAGPLAVLRNTILFSLAGAMIQVVAAWMIYFVARKEARRSAGKDGDKNAK